MRALSTPEYRYVIYVRVVHHRGERVVGVARGKLMLHMLFPEFTQTLLRRGQTLVYARLLRFGHRFLLLCFE